MKKLGKLEYTQIYNSPIGRDFFLAHFNPPYNNTMKNPFYQYVTPNFKSPRHMGFSHYKAEYNKYLFVIYPFHYVISIAWWVQLKWAMHTNKPSWIELEVRKRNE
jgi:hypothetical protein